jgi:phosphoglycerate dehydrogenase-like enzyme
MTSPAADELLGPDGLAYLLRNSDAVVLALPETAESDGMIGAPQLTLMRQGSVLCNIARGSLVDEDALLEALRSGHLRAAVLDVARQEPLPVDSPLWDAPNLYYSPHSAASQDGYFDRLIDLFATNLLHYVRGEGLVNLVDPQVGY